MRHTRGKATHLRLLTASRAEAEGEEKVEGNDKQKEKGEGHADGDDARAPTQGQKLPHRLRLSAFSKRVGHRPTGIQVAQVKLFMERFPTEFRTMAVHQIVLPCHQGLPFVTPGGIPCPTFSTVNALKWLENNPGALAKGHDTTIKQINEIHQRGLQVAVIGMSMSGTALASTQRRV